MINQTISNFKILKKLGEGGMGVVYKAEDTKLERQVAIKFLPREIAAQDDVKKRFKIEAKAAAALNHPNIATIYQIEEVDDKMFIVMEYVEGQELRQLVKTLGSVPIDDAITYAIQIAEGLQAAHKKGVVHRDIKGANIMLTENGQVKIMDFGLAKLSGQTQLTKEGMTVGTIAYMSPEQAQGMKVDQRADIWSFGVVLYEMLTGHVPFRGDYEQAILYSIMNEEPEPIPDLQNGGDLGLQQVVSKALAKDPEDRYQEMEDVLVDLRAITGATKTAPVMRAVERHSVGREKELAELHAALQNAFSGQSLLLCVAGEPGIGKTTLVEQFLDEVTIGGRPCLITQGQCSERLAGTEAYLPFLEVLAGLLQKEVDVSVAKLMREMAPWWYVQVAALSPDDAANTGILADVQTASQERVKRELVAFLQEVSSKRPLLLFFEDLHWADVSSIDMLAYLAPKFDAMRLLIVTTYRPEELLLTKHPFLQIKPDLLSRGQCREISLGFLPRQEIEQYLTLEFPDHNFPEAFAKLIHDKTEGSPLFMVDLLRDLKNREVIVEEKERWQLARSVEDIKLELPDSVKGMIERKIQHLGENDHRLLVAASIQGFKFDSAVVGKVLEMDEEEVEERLQKLERDHLFVHITEEDEFPDRTLTLRYRFVHALYQNELYSSLARTKRSRLSRTAAEALESFYGEESSKVASELASLFEAARDFAKAVDYFGKAAQHAASVFAYQEAIALASRGLKLLDTLPESKEKEQRELSLRAYLGGSLLATRGYADEGAGKAYTRVRELSKKLGLDVENAVAVSGLIPYLLTTLQQAATWDLGQELLELGEKEENMLLLSTGHSTLGMAEQFLGNFATGSIHLERVVELDEAQKQDSDASMAGWTVVVTTLDHLAWNVWILGYPDQALQHSLKSKAHAEETRNPVNLVHYLGFAGFLHQGRGDVEKVLELSEECIAVSQENAYHLNMAWAIMQKGWALTQKGDREEGLAMMLEGLATWREMGMVCLVPYWHALIAEIHGQLEQPEKGLALIEESFEIVNKTDHRMWEAELHRIKGELLLMQSKAESEIEACYKKAMEVARAQEAKSLELRAVMSLSRLWQSQGKNKEAKEMLDKIYSWFTEGFKTKDLREAKQLLAEL